MTKLSKKELADKREAFMKDADRVQFRLDQFRRNLKFGYSDSNFTTMAYDFEKLSPHLSLEQYNILGELWSRSYTTKLTSDEINDTINSL